MRPADLPVIRGWIAAPHLARWWPNPEGALRTITRHLFEPGIERFTLTMDGRDVGFLQLYDPHQAPLRAAVEQTSGHAYRDQPRGTRPCTGWGHLPRKHRDNLKPTVSP